MEKKSREETPREECIHVYCIHLLRYKAYNKLTGDSSTIFETCISSGSRHSSELFHLPLLIFFCLVLMVLLHASAVEFMIFPLQLLDVAESELPKVQCSVHICNQAPSPGCPGNCTGKDNSQPGYLQSVDFRQLFSSDLEISSTAGLLF